MEETNRTEELKQQISVILDELSQIRMLEIAEEEGEDAEPHGAVLNWTIIVEHQSMLDAAEDYYNILSFDRVGQSRATSAGLLALANTVI